MQMRWIRTLEGISGAFPGLNPIRAGRAFFTDMDTAIKAIDAGLAVPDGDVAEKLLAAELKTREQATKAQPETASDAATKLATEADAAVLKEEAEWLAQHPPPEPKAVNVRTVVTPEATAKIQKTPAHVPAKE